MRMKNRIEYVLKHNRIIQKMYVLFFSTLFKLLSLFIKLDGKLILFSSFSGKKFNDSPRVIYENLKKNTLFDDFRMVWAFEKPEDFHNENVEMVKIDSFRYFVMAIKAKFWITNVNIERGLHFKRKRQLYLNTWHGTGPKTIGNAVSGRKDYDFKKIDFLCSDGEYLKNIFVQNFNANPNNVIMCGRPREDVLYNLNDAINTEIRNKYGIPLNAKVILYTPTWRESRDKGSTFVFENELNISELLNQLDDDYIVLFRAHSITNKASNITFSNKIIDVTAEPDINPLFIAADILITDYSSTPTDFCILHKPFICFAPDYELYVKNRGLCFDINDKYPFGVLKTTNSVIKIIKELEKNSHIDEYESFKLWIAPYGGNATNTCVEKLFNISLK